MKEHISLSSEIAGREPVGAWALKRMSTVNMFHTRLHELCYTSKFKLCYIEKFSRLNILNNLFFNFSCN